MAGYIIRFATLGALLGTMAMFQAPAVAQEEKTLEEITVTAPRVTRERRDLPYGKTITVNKSVTVDASDLDLRMTADMMELENRVEKAAERICHDLSEELPFGQPSTPVCIARTVDDTMAQVRDIVQ